ncbi:acyltransferase [Variovorax sp. J31P207]|uniref:acyltransferase family protein n=1 Tax=Variovorax sp. J31P207 TaxID=3053510 RepID=UPI0025768DC5|nr:acyltransferase [Variovorax sp. J31P207]MDM0066707.1 acyltransferase [Variovorax sp. J31P207]
MQYNPALDGLRALSILAVLLFHCDIPGARGGFVGLDVFFVLSGYLITSMLSAEYRQGGIEIGRFYARRALRLYPTLLLMVAVYLGLAPMLWPDDNRWLSAVLAALYVYDYALAFWEIAYTIGHTWSLGVEEKFYLLWPLALPLLLRTRHPVGWLVSSFFAVTAWRYFVAMNWTWSQAYFCFDTRMSGILLGAIAALTRFRVSRHALTVACIALAVLMTLPSLPTSDQIEAVTLRITLAELSAFVLVCYAAEHGKMKYLASRPAAYVGRLSYGIYLWHFPFALLLRSSQPGWVTLSATVAFSFTMAAICLHLVDAPLKRWRQKAWPQTQTAV